MWFVGFPKQANSSGQTATIQTYGSVVEGLSGLTVGRTHYVQPNGSVGTTAPDSSHMWQYGEGITWDSSSSSAIYTSWNPTASSATDTGNDFRNSPLAGIAVSSTKLLLTPAVHQDQPYQYVGWAWNHKH